MSAFISLAFLILTIALMAFAWKKFSFGRETLNEKIRLETENSRLLMENERVSAKNAALQKDIGDWNLRCGKLEAELAGEKRNREEERANWRRAEGERERRFEETIAKVEERMKNATADMLKARSADFSKSNAENMEGIVKPLRDFLEKSKQEMAENVLKQGTLSGELKAQIAKALEMSERAKASAEELTRVFKHESKVQGDWGETVLNELLESQGLREGVHYDTQATLRDSSGNAVKSEGGNSLRPDVILHLDDMREVIIDSKVSISAYIRYVNAESEIERQKNLKEHVSSLRKHVEELAKKDYSKYVRPPKEKMDYVIMFVPHSAALWTALREEPTLWREAMQKNVYVADEQTLYAALRIIELTWRRIAHVQNQQKVFDLAEEMLDRVGQFTKRFEEVGASLGKAQKAFEDAQKKLSPSGPSILQTCKKLKDLGAKESRRNPLPLLGDDSKKISPNGEIG